MFLLSLALTALLAAPGARGTDVAAFAEDAAEGIRGEVVPPATLAVDVDAEAELVAALLALPPARREAVRVAAFAGDAAGAAVPPALAGATHAATLTTDADAGATAGFKNNAVGVSAEDLPSCSSFGGVDTKTPSTRCCPASCGAHCGAPTCAHAVGCCGNDAIERVCGVDDPPCLKSTTIPYTISLGCPTFNKMVTAVDSTVASVYTPGYWDGPRGQKKQTYFAARGEGLCVGMDHAEGTNRIYPSFEFTHPKTPQGCAITCLGDYIVKRWGGTFNDYQDWKGLSKDHVPDVIGFTFYEDTRVMNAAAVPHPYRCLCHVDKNSQSGPSAGNFGCDLLDDDGGKCLGTGPMWTPFGPNYFTARDYMCYQRMFMD